MKKMGKLFVVMLVVLCVLGLAACDDGNDTTAATTTGTPAETTTGTPEPTTTGPQTEHEHTFGEWKTATGATCTTDGLEERVCECGEKETRAITATGHGQTEIRNGKAATCTEKGYSGDTYCTVCNEKIADGTAVEASGHEYQEEIYKLSTYGACGGTLTVESCKKCGLARDMVISGIDSCDWEEKEYQKTDEEIHGIMECPDCGFRYESDAKLSSVDGCVSQWQGYMRMTIGEKELYYDIETTMEDHKEVDFKEDLSEHGFCGGTYYYRKCLACETITYSNVYTYCDWVKQEVNEDGFTVYQCSYCNAYRYHKKTEEKDGCRVSYVTTDIYQQGEYKITVEDSGTSYEHDYAYDYVLSGEDCTGAWTCTATCKNCGTSYEKKGEGHDSSYHSEELGEQGLCDGKLWYYECNICGQIGYVYYYGDCNWVAQGVNADGFTVYHCAQCDAYRYEKYVESENGCVYSYSMAYRVQLGDYTFEQESSGTVGYHDYQYQYTLTGATCVDGWTCTVTCANCDFRKETSGKGHVKEYQRESLSDHGFCGGQYRCYQCAVCGEITDPYMDTWCAWKEQGVNAEGFTVCRCSRCGAYWSCKSTEEKDGCCVSYTTTDIYQQGEYKITIEDSGKYYQHEYVYTYKRYGETCADGWTCTVTCKNCDYKEEYTDIGHDLEYKTEDLSEHGICGGYYNYAQCTICGEIAEGEIIAEDCNWEEQGVNAEGFTVLHCYVCGAYAYTKETTETDGCHYKYTYTGILQKGDYKVTMENTEEGYDHDYEYAYELKGETCDDGWTYVVTCKNCDYRRESSGSGHRTEWHSEDLSEHGSCGGYYEYEKCTICGEITYSYADVWCNWEYQEETEDGVNVWHCSECGAYRYYKRTEERNNCTVSYSYTNIYKLGEYEFTVESSGEYDEHDLEYVYELNGDSCDDGWTRTATCKTCGESWTYSGYGHNHRWCSENMSEYGFCGGQYRYFQCAICGEITDSDVSTQCNWKYQGENEDGFDVYRCSYCGAYRHYKWIEDRDVCYVTWSHTDIYQQGEYEFTIEDSAGYYDHDLEYAYELKGETCADGWTCVESCKNCEYRDEYSGEGHVTEKFEEDLSKHGFCGGYYEYQKCSICGEITDSDAYTWCRWKEQGENEDGFTVYKCSYCGACLYIKEIAECDGCHVSYTYTAIYQLGEYELTIEGSGEYDDHDCEYVYKLTGDTCADGWTRVESCKNCEYRAEYSGSGHRTERFEVDLSEYGFCGGYYEYKKCAICGEITDSDVNERCSWEVQGENEDGFTVCHCSECGAYLYIKGTEERDGCHVTWSGTSIYQKDEYQITIEYSDEYYEHDLEYAYKLTGDTCADGWICVESCKNCEYRGEYSGSGHRTESFEDDLSDYGFCGGWYRGEKCVICSEITYSYANAKCGWRYQEETEDGFTVYKCSKCGAYRYYKRTEERNNCIVSYSYTYIYKLGEYEFTREGFAWYYEHEYAYTCAPINGVDGAEGWAYTATCSACGGSYEYESSMLQTDAVIVMPDETKYQPINLGEKKITISDLTKGEDGNYYYDGSVVYIAVNNWNDFRGFLLSDYVEDYGNKYFDTTYWEELSAATGESGYAVLNDDTLLWLKTLITGNRVWEETEANLPTYLYCYITA